MPSAWDLTSRMAVGWCGTKVRLAPLDEERHLEGSLKWVNDPDRVRRCRARVSGST